MRRSSRRGTVKIGRNARNGRFTTVKAAGAKRRTHVVETIRRKR